MLFHSHSVQSKLRAAGMLTVLVTVYAIQYEIQAQAESNNEVVVASVNDDRIFEQPLLEELNLLAGDLAMNSPEYQRLRKQVLTSAIQRRLALAYLTQIDQAASADDIQLGVIQLEKRLALKQQSIEEYLQEKHINREELHHRIAWQISWPKYSNQFLNDKNYENFYLRNRSQFDGTQLQVSQILLHTNQQQDRTLVQTRELAENVLQQLSKGTIEFPDAARKYSDSPTGKTGGAVGWIKFGGAMPRTFNEAAFALKPGQISPLVETPFGIHIIRVEQEKAGAISWQMARPAIRDAMIKYLLTFLSVNGRKMATVEISEGWK